MKFKFKALLFVTVFLFAVSFFSSCSSARDRFKDYDRHMLPLLGEDVDYDIPDDILCCCVSDGKYYWYDGKTVFSMNLKTRENAELLEKENIISIAADQDHLYLAEDGVITVKGMKGEEDTVIDLPEEVSEDYCFDACGGIIMCGSGNTIWKYSGGKWSGSNITDTDVVMDSSRGDFNMSAATAPYISCVRIINDISAALIMTMDSEYEFAGMTETDYVKCLYSFDFDSGMTEFLSGNVTDKGIDINGGNIYMTNGAGNTVRKIGADGQTSVVRKVSSGDVRLLGGGAVRCFCVSDKTVFIDWMYNKATLFSPKSMEGMLKIASTANDSEKLYKAFGYETAFQPIIYDDDKLVTKLSEKLLAGDSDFDIAWVRDESGEIIDFLNAILSYGQYTDLNENSSLAAHLKDMYPGALDMLTADDGKVGIIPTDSIFFVMGCYKGHENILNDIGAEEWTDKYLWEICDKLIERNDGTTLFPKALPGKTARVLFDVLSGAVSESSDTESVIGDFLTSMKKYIDAKVFTGSSYHVVDVMNIGTFSTLGMKPDYNDLSVIQPLVIGENGKSAMQITGFFWVNPNSTNREKALEFLAELTDETKRYNTDIYNSPLWPEVSDYGTIMMFDYHEIAYDENGEEKEKTYIPAGTRQRVWSSVYDGYFDDLNDNMDEIWKRYTISKISMNEQITRTLQDFIAGKASLDDTKSDLLRAMNYMIQG